MKPFDPESGYPLLRDFILPIGFLSQSLISVQERQPEKAVFCLAAAVLLPVLIRQTDKIITRMASNILSPDSHHNLLTYRYITLCLANIILVTHSATQAAPLIRS